MWSRITFYSLCYLAVVNCIPQVGDQFNNFQSQSPLGNDRNSEQGISSFGSEKPAGGSNQNFNNRKNEIRPGSSGQPVDEFGQSSGSSRPNQQHLEGRPTGESIGTGHREGENRPFGSRPSATGENSFSRPTGGSTHTTDYNRPSGLGSGVTGGSSLSRPAGGSTHTDHNRPSGLGSSNSGGSSISRPDTNHREGENSFGSSNTGENSFSQPAGGSSHTTHRPLGLGSSNSGGSRPLGGSTHTDHNRPSGLGSSNSGGSSISRPDTNHREGENSFGSSNTGENSFSQPAGGSSHTTHRPLGLGSSNSGGSRPTGGSTHIPDHREGESRPTGFTDGHQGGRPTGEFNNQQTGFSPDNQQQFSGGSKPTSQQGHPSTEQNLGQTDNNKGTADGKEDEKDVCFGPLGCFKMGKPWKSVLRPIGPPHGPEKIQTTVHFYSRENLEKQKNITLYPQINMGEVRFDPSKITAIIVHGFFNSGNATWMKDMKNVYLKKVDANVMIVDWGKGAQLLNYLQVAGNTRVVGKQLGLFVKHLISNYKADPGKFHLIGHSLGAQICSYLGKEVPGIARLTALDPAQPGFEGFDTEVRLDKNDAEFVDVIHTDARPFIPTLGFGMITPHGHVDFYMNGGFDQPGCAPPPKKELPSVKNILDLAKYPVEVISKTVACPHARAYEYLIESFNETENCIFWGHKADVKNVFKSVTNTVTQGLLKKFTALSPTCSKEDCIPVGFATKKSPLRGVFVVTTNSRSPYCISEPGIPPETPPQGRNFVSNIQKIARKTGLSN